MVRAFLLLITLVLLAGCVTGTKEESMPSSGSAHGPSMPPLSARLESMRDFYRFEFLADGYPGKREDGRLFPHPIYGSYFIKDYIKQYESAPSDKLRDAISTVAHASVKRMKNFKGSLVFWYEPDPARGARLYEKHYSGLTQSYYAVQLHRAGQILGDRSLIRAASRVFDSLLIPADEGGVYYHGRQGVSIAEVPQTPNSWILNGWQSALVSISDYARLSGSQEARDLVARSADTMAKMLPMYDVRTLKNSRYGLTGYTYLRLIFEHRPQRVTGLRNSIPGEGSFLLPSREGSRWQLRTFPRDLDKNGTPKSKSIQMNIVLSLKSAPEANRLLAEVKAAQPGLVKLQAQLGDYEPEASGPINNEWVEIGRKHLQGGSNDLSFDIPIETIGQVVYPTNFVKRIDGQQVNVYHVIHIARLRKLAKITGISELDNWANRWHRYICQWQRMRIYEGLKVRTSDGSSNPSAAC